MRVRVVFASLLLPLTILTLSAPIEGQSLADVAKAEEQRRSTVKQPAKLYTNADLSDGKSAGAIGNDASKSDTTKAAPRSEKTKDNGAVQTPLKSGAQAMRADAEATFSRRLRDLRTTTDDGWRNYARYMKACDGKVTTVRPAMPPGIPLDDIVFGGSAALVAQGRLLPPGTTAGPLEIDNETTPECRLLSDDITAASTTVQRELDDIEEAARRRGIYPGIVRDLFAAHGFRPK